MEWAANLEHLQTVFRKFDADAVILEPVLMRLFRNGLRSSIRAEAKQEGRRKDIWDQAIKNAITAKAKPALNLPLWVRKMDVCYSRGHRSTSKPTENHRRDRSFLLFRP